MFICSKSVMIVLLLILSSKSWAICDEEKDRLASAIDSYKKGSYSYLFYLNNLDLVSRQEITAAKTALIECLSKNNSNIFSRLQNHTNQLIANRRIATINRMREQLLRERLNKRGIDYDQIILKRDKLAENILTEIQDKYSDQMDEWQQMLCDSVTEDENDQIWKQINSTNQQIELEYENRIVSDTEIRKINNILYVE